jgi:hypothetical protein
MLLNNIKLILVKFEDPENEGLYYTRRIKDFGGWWALTAVGFGLVRL